MVIYKQFFFILDLRNQKEIEGSVPFGKNNNNKKKTLCVCVHFVYHSDNKKTHRNTETNTQSFVGII
jgi:hypothetical protein